MNFKTQIEHVVVLMMENHSFDHMLGWLPGVGELTGNECNEYKGRSYTTLPERLTFTTQPGPMHEFCNVNLQVAGTGYKAEDPQPLDDPASITMSGFVKDYILHADPTGPPPNGENVMACYRPEQLPVISQLAQTFRVCRRWFCSVPGPTGPNRIYANCASSAGYAGGSYQATLQCPGGNGMMPSEMMGLSSIFGVVAANGGTWGVYHEDPITSKDPFFSPELILNDVRAHPVWVQRDPGFKAFYGNIQAGVMPNYSFLTPNLWRNSQHPSDDVRYGECVMANVYEMIANSSYWEKTLLVITYDEHGGFYDSVPTPTGVPNPDGQNWTPPPPPSTDAGPPFFFDRLGVRVPAILISPYIEAQVDDTQYEHSSIPATVMQLFGLTWPDLPPPAPPHQRNQRIEKANTFKTAIGSTLRKDVPLTLPRPPAGTGDYTPLPPPLFPV
jgi:phospholipase C